MNRCDSTANASFDVPNYWWNIGFLLFPRTITRGCCATVHKGNNICSVFEIDIMATVALKSSLTACPSRKITHNLNTHVV